MLCQPMLQKLDLEPQPKQRNNLFCSLFHSNIISAILFFCIAFLAIEYPMSRFAQANKCRNSIRNYYLLEFESIFIRILY